MARVGSPASARAGPMAMSGAGAVPGRVARSAEAVAVLVLVDPFRFKSPYGLPPHPRSRWFRFCLLLESYSVSLLPLNSFLQKNEKLKKLHPVL